MEKLEDLNNGLYKFCEATECIYYINHEVNVALHDEADDSLFATSVTRAPMPSQQPGPL